jgi:acyl-CoA thioesterase FadM
MLKKQVSKITVDFKELLMSEVVQSEALINLLDKKSLVFKQELLKEMKRVQASMIKSQ